MEKKDGCPGFLELKEIASEAFLEYKNNYENINNSYTGNDIHVKVSNIQEIFRNRLYNFTGCDSCNISKMPEDYLALGKNRAYKERLLGGEDVSIRYVVKKGESIFIRASGNILDFVNGFSNKILSTFERDIDRESIDSLEKGKSDLSLSLYHLLDNSIKGHLGISDIYETINDKNFSRHLLENRFKFMCEFLDKNILIYAEFNKNDNIIELSIIDEGNGFDIDKFAGKNSDSERGISIVKAISKHTLLYNDSGRQASCEISL